MPFEIQRAEEKEERIARPTSVARAAGKGLLKGIEQFGRAFGPLMDEYQPERFGEFLEEQLPTEPGVFEQFAERGGELFPFAATGGAGALESILRTLGAAAAGTGARQLGAPEPVAQLAELGPFLAPRLPRRIQPTEAQREQVEFLRRFGAAEEEIAPLLQKEKKVNVLAKIAQKKGPLQERLQETKERIGFVYETLRESPAAKEAISPKTTRSVIKKLQDKLGNLPANVRNLIQEDYADLVDKTITGDSLLNFYQDVNANLAKSKGKLGVLKEPVKNALAELSPQLANDFEMTNRLYATYGKLASKLKPSMASDMIEAAIPVQVIYGAVTGNLGLLKATALEYGAKKLATEALTSPRFVNLSKKLVSALNKGKFVAANQIKDQMAREMNKQNPEIASLMYQADLQELEN